jgi:hypothetical protein
MVAPDYEMCGKVDVLPIAVDTNVFRPPQDKAKLRQDLGLPVDRVLGIWCGTNHPMKGFDLLCPYAQANPDIFWIIVWKSQQEQADCPFEGRAYVKVEQRLYAALLSCANFYASPSRLRPYYMCEWEAMATGLPFIDLAPVEREFEVPVHSREHVIDCGWARYKARDQWLEYLERVSK